MPGRVRILSAVTLSLVLAACGSLHLTRHPAPPSATAPAAGGHATRYCEPNGAWDGWSCGQRPAPVPPPPVRPAAPVAQQLPAIYASVPPVAAAAGATAPEDAATTAAPADAAGDAPAWRRLAWRAASSTPLQEVPSEFYVVQIVAMSSFEALQAFRHAHGLDGVLGARIESRGRIYYALLLGVYRNLADARAAADARPASLAHYQLWFRKMDSLKAAVARADALASAER